MNKRDMVDVLQGRTPEHIPLWELKFHLWGRASGRHFTYKTEYMSLSTKDRHSALCENARILVEEARLYGHSAITIPSPPWQTEYELPMEDRPALVRLLKQCAPDVMVIASCGGVIGMPDASIYEEFCYQMYDEPEAIDQECERLLERSLIKMAPLLEAGIDALYTPSDIADNHGPFFNPEFMGRFVLPFLDRWSDAVHRGGAFAILHTDGKISPIMDSLAETAVDAIQSIDSVAGMRMDTALDQARGRVALVGNVDCGLLITGTEQEVYDHTRDIIRACRRKPGFVLGASNAVVEETPMQNYLAMIRAYKDAHD